jgi:hypothetical protein
VNKEERIAEKERLEQEIKIKILKNANKRNF